MWAIIEVPKMKWQTARFVKQKWEHSRKDTPFAKVGRFDRRLDNLVPTN
jgi:hypothetical protein